MLRFGCCHGISPKSIVGSAFCPLLTWLHSQRAAWKESLSLQQEWIGHCAPVGSLPDHHYPCAQSSLYLPILLTHTKPALAQKLMFGPYYF